MADALKGRVAIITGGARGQGEATVRLFAAEGARVVIADVLTEEGTALANEIGTAAFFYKLDVSNEESWKALVAEIADRWNAHADILINNAGIVHVATLLELELEDLDRVLRVNLIGAWLGMKTVAPLMIAAGKGAIVNICSSAGIWGMNGLMAYSASKWALRGLSKSAALELGHRGVRVNTVFPGGMNTKMGNVSEGPAEDINKYYRGQPIQRIGEPSEVAQTSLFLVSDQASYVCGAEVTVDGGMTAGVFSEFLPGGPDVSA